MTEDEQARYRATYLNERCENMGLAQALRSEGRQQGRLEGRQEDAVRLLKRRLTRRFGPLPDWAESQLSKASTDQLELWADRILGADSLDAAFHQT